MKHLSEGNRLLDSLKKWDYYFVVIHSGFRDEDHAEFEDIGMNDEDRDLWRKEHVLIPWDWEKAFTLNISSIAEKVLRRA